MPFIDPEWSKPVTAKGKAKKQAAQCYGKIPYPTATVANQTLAHMARHNLITRSDNMGYYRCPHCNKWHIGSDAKAITTNSRRIFNKRRRGGIKRGRKKIRP